MQSYPLSLTIKSLTYCMTQTAWGLWWSIPSLWAKNISWNISISVLISVLTILSEIAEIMASWKGLALVVSSTDGSWESCEAAQGREGEAQTKPCAEGSWGQLLLPLSPSQGCHYFWDCPICWAFPQISVSCSPSHTVTALAGTSGSTQELAEERTSGLPGVSSVCPAGSTFPG